MMDDRQLASFIRKKVNRAINAPASETSDLREECLDRYRRDLWGDEEEGRSKFVTSEVFEAVEWCLPKLAQVFLSTDAVKFQPVSPNDANAARIESSIINTLIKQKPEYWAAFLDTLKDALLYPNAYLKTSMRQQRHRDVEHFTKVPEYQVPLIQQALLEQGGDIEILDVDEYLQDQQVYLDFTVVTDKGLVPELYFECVPPEQVLVDEEHRQVDLDSCNFVAHRCDKTYTELREMGFSADELDGVPTSQTSALFDSSEAQNRNDFEEEQYGTTSTPVDDSMQLYDYVEAYLRYDASGEGVAELRKVVLVGNEVLLNEPCDAQPFSAFTCIRQTHSHIGMSIAQTLLQMQYASSFFTRQLFDNVHSLGTGRTYFSLDGLVGDGTTLEALRDPSSTVVFTAGAPQNSIMRDQPNPVVQSIMPLVDSFDRKAEKRSGVTIGSGMDPDVLQKTTATNVGNASEQMSSRIQLMVQTLAETGFRSAFMKAHELLRQHVSGQMHTQIGDQWHSYSPSSWVKRTNVTVSTGLGLGNKAERMQFGLQLVGIQKEMMAMGLVTPQEMYNTLALLVDSFNIGHVSNFFVDPSSPKYQPPQPPPDAQMELAKAEMQKAQAQQQANQVRAQVDMSEIEAKRELNQQQLHIERLKLELEEAKLRTQIAETLSRIEGNKVADVVKILGAQADNKLKYAQATAALDKDTGNS